VIRALLPLGLLVLAGCTQGGDTAGAHPPIDPERIAEHVRVLASDEFEGRAPATRGEELTVAYISEQLQAAGVEPGGVGGSWFQEVPLNQYEMVGPPQLSFTINGRRRALTQGEEIAARASMLNIDRVSIENAPVVFLGYGVRAPERNWDDFKGQDMNGKVGIVLINDPDFETGDGDFGGKAMTYYGRWTYKYEEAARQGMIAMLVVHETEPASYGWATVRNSNTNAMFDIVRENPAEVHPMQEGWIQRDLAVELLRAGGHDFETLKRQAQTREFQPVTLENVTFSAAYDIRRETIRTRNVLGKVTGSRHPNETILYGAHWDHLGIGRPDARGDSIHNGAVDNAIGTAVVMELARVFAAGPKPERTLVFALWAAEERGLLGSEYYATNPVYPLATTVAGVNIDAPKPTGASRDIVVIGYGQSELEDRLEPLVTASGRVIAPDANPDAGYFFRSDHFPMAKRGVPMLYTDEGVDLLEGGTEAGRAAEEEYRRDRYHQPADEYDPETWDFTRIVQDAELFRQLGWELATSRDWPNYRETSEFRPARDASAAERSR
jgi:Zn-dependent M28 family amino/carboxypeptidase